MANASLSTSPAELVAIIRAARLSGDRELERSGRRDAPELIDAGTLASLLSVSKPTVWRWKEAGKLPPAITLSAQCVRWKRATVFAWLDSLDAPNEQRPAAGNGRAFETSKRSGEREARHE